MEAGSSDSAAAHDDEPQPWYRRKFNHRQRWQILIPLLLGILCFALGHFTGSTTASVVGTGLMLIGLVVGWSAVGGFYREDRAERKRRGQLAE